MTGARYYLNGRRIAHVSFRFSAQSSTISMTYWQPWRRISVPIEPPKSDLLISVVTAVRDAAGYIEAFLRETAAVLDASFKDFEIVVVDNGSRDETARKIELLQLELKNIQLYCLGARVSQEMDIVIAVEQAIGDVVVTIDAVYDPPALIHDMVESFQSGTEIVYGLRRDRTRREGLSAYQLLASIFFTLYRSMTGEDVPFAVSGFRLMSRRVVN